MQREQQARANSEMTQERAVQRIQRSVKAAMGDGDLRATPRAGTPRFVPGAAVQGLYALAPPQDSPHSGPERVLEGAVTQYEADQAFQRWAARAGSPSTASPRQRRGSDSTLGEVGSAGRRPPSHLLEGKRRFRMNAAEVHADMMRVRALLRKEEARLEKDEAALHAERGALVAAEAEEEAVGWQVTFLLHALDALASVAASHNKTYGERVATRVAGLRRLVERVAPRSEGAGRGRGGGVDVDAFERYLAKFLREDDRRPAGVPPLGGQGPGAGKDTREDAGNDAIRAMRRQFAAQRSGNSLRAPEAAPAPAAGR